MCLTGWIARIHGGTTQNVNMNVVDDLLGIVAVVDDDAESAF